MTWWDRQDETYLDQLLTTGINGPEDRTRGWIANYVAENVRDFGEVLDVGCGTGEVIARLLEHGGYTITGVDPSGKMLGLCWRRFRAEVAANRVTLQRASVEALPFADGRFSVAVCRHVLDHLQDYHAACAELTRVARRVVVVLFNPVGDAYVTESPTLTRSHDLGIYDALGTDPSRTVYLDGQAVIVSDRRGGGT